jgi:hypothetical protein
MSIPDAVVSTIERHDWKSLREKLADIEHAEALADQLVQSVKTFSESRGKIRVRKIAFLDGIALKWEIIGIEAPCGEVLFVSVGWVTIGTGDLLTWFGVNEKPTVFDLAK